MTYRFDDMGNKIDITIRPYLLKGEYYDKDGNIRDVETEKRGLIKIKNKY